MHTKMSLYAHFFPKSVCIETIWCALHTSFFTVFVYRARRNLEEISSELKREKKILKLFYCLPSTLSYPHRCMSHNFVNKWPWDMPGCIV